MVRRIYLATALLGLQAYTSSAAEFDVYILTGQSNSLGTTGLEGRAPAYEPGDDAADAQTSFFWSNVNASNTAFPPNLYGDSGGAITTLQKQQGDGGANPYFWGPEFGFARSMFDATGNTDLLIIKASRGGGGNTYWDIDTFNADSGNGHMWGHLVGTVDTALELLNANGNTFEVRGFMYLQGESNDGTEAGIAGARLGDLIDNLQTHINGAYASTADNMHTVIGEIAASNSNSSRITTTTQQIDLAASDSMIDFVGTSDLPLKSDDIHFGRDAKLTIGERFADVFIGVSEQPNGIVGDVNQNGVVFGDGTDLADVDDVTAFVAGWRSITVGLTNLEKTMAGDLNLDGRTSLPDAHILHGAIAAQGGEFPFEMLLAVPEPASASVMLLAVLVSACRQRRTRAEQALWLHTM